MSTKTTTFEQLRLLATRCASYTTTKILELTNVVNTRFEEFNTKKADKTAVLSLSLPASWTNNGDGTFKQSVTIQNGTAKSKIDLQPNSVVMNRLISDGVEALYVANDSGIFTAYAVGAAPTVALTIQATLMEVE